MWPGTGGWTILPPFGSYVIICLFIEGQTLCEYREWLFLVIVFVSVVAVCINGAFTLEDLYGSVWQNFWCFINTLEMKGYNLQKRLIRTFWPKASEELMLFCMFIKAVLILSLSVRISVMRIIKHFKSTLCVVWNLLMTVEIFLFLIGFMPGFLCAVHRVTLTCLLRIYTQHDKYYFYLGQRKCFPIPQSAACIWRHVHHMGCIRKSVIYLLSRICLP